MKKPKKNEEREERIMMGIIVDTNGPEEQAMGWYYYLEDKIHFPLQQYAMKSEPSHRSWSKMRLMSVGWLLRKNVREKCSLLCGGKGMVWQFHYLSSPLLIQHPQRLLKKLKISTIGLKVDIDFNVTWHNPVSHGTPNGLRL
jgi:hypothetical protein